MERLTCKYEEENVLRAMCTFDRGSDTEVDDCVSCYEVCDKFIGQGCAECPIQQAFDRLSEYEDTELTPEQIKEMDKLYAEKCKEVAELHKKYNDAERKRAQCKGKTLREYNI